MTKEKKIGFFWIKVTNDPESWVRYTEGPQVAYWDGASWYQQGVEIAIPISRVKVLSKCLAPPKCD